MQIILSFIISLSGVLVLTPLVKKICLRANLLDYPSPRRIHKTPTPRLGGVAIALSFLASIFVLSIFFKSTLSELSEYLPALLISGSIILGLGIYDDLKPLPGLVKFSIQVLASLILIWGKIKIGLLYIPFYGIVELKYLSYPVTLLWLVGIMNSINLIDGLDGLASGLSVFVAATLLFVGVSLKISFLTVFSSAILGACLGFLRYNYFPAQIFMGDSGAYFLGYLFAVISVLFPIKSYTAIAMFVPLLALALPIFETFFSLLRRLLSKKPFYHPDKRHLHNLLLHSGLSQKTTVWIFYLLSIIFSFLAIGVLAQRQQKSIFIAIFLILLLLVLVSIILSVKTKPDSR